MWCILKEALIIGDIAGEFDALQRLVGMVDSNVPVIGVGDLCDRGPNSASVIDWFMKTERADSVKGNHEDMMIDYCLHQAKGLPGRYERGVWLMNGGGTTLRSYEDYRDQLPPQGHIDWLAGRKLSLTIHSPAGKCIITHAAIHKKFSLNQALFFDVGTDPDDPEFEYSLIWNRHEPIQRDYFQVFGHNSHWGLKVFGEQDKAWAICIDQSRRQILTGFHWPTGEILEAPYEVNKLPQGAQREL